MKAVGEGRGWGGLDLKQQLFWLQLWCCDRSKRTSGRKKKCKKSNNFWYCETDFGANAAPAKTNKPNKKKMVENDFKYPGSRTQKIYTHTKKKYFFLLLSTGSTTCLYSLYTTATWLSQNHATLLMLFTGSVLAIIKSKKKGKKSVLLDVPRGKICNGSGSSPFIRWSFIVLQYWGEK